MIERRGARTGLMTTRGTGDVLLIMRGTAGSRAGRSRGRPRLDPAAAAAAGPAAADRGGLTAPRLERPRGGRPRRGGDHARGRAAARPAASTRWRSASSGAFSNPGHEQRTAALLRERFPDLYVSYCSDLAQRMGRVRADRGDRRQLLRRPAARRLSRRRCWRSSAGAATAAARSSCSATGGVMTPEEASASALLTTLDSGPAGGIIGSAGLARTGGSPNVICTDMGGTSFDVGLIVDGRAGHAPRARCLPSTPLGAEDRHPSVGTGGGSSIALRPAAGR